ncbi:MAG: flagellar export chaperone FlgN [Oscillospiraceae bacterium]|nr:flagellar export chaperone FlgN [Oscillospiraceae bacterium]
MTDMTTAQALQIIEFLEDYNKHFLGCVSFLNLKQQKVLGDDLVWLHDSLPEEQRLSMAGASLENKRLELMKALGFENHTSSQLLEMCPQEAKNRFKSACEALENSIDKIKGLNADILEIVEKKLEVAEKLLDNQFKHKALTGPGFYDRSSNGGVAKVRMTDPADEIIGKM